LSVGWRVLEKINVLFSGGFTALNLMNSTIFLALRTTDRRYLADLAIANLT